MFHDDFITNVQLSFTAKELKKSLNTSWSEQENGDTTKTKYYEVIYIAMRYNNDIY